MILLDKKLGALLHSVTSKDPTRPHMSYVRVTKGTYFAIDGVICVKIHVAKDESQSDYFTVTKAGACTVCTEPTNAVLNLHEEIERLFLRPPTFHAASTVGIASQYLKILAAIPEVLNSPKSAIQLVGIGGDVSPMRFFVQGVNIQEFADIIVMPIRV